MTLRGVLHIFTFLSKENIKELNLITRTVLSHLSKQPITHVKGCGCGFESMLRSVNQSSQWPCVMEWSILQMQPASLYRTLRPMAQTVYAMRLHVIRSEQWGHFIL